MASGTSAPLNVRQSGSPFTRLETTGVIGGVSIIELWNLTYRYRSIFSESPMIETLRFAMTVSSDAPSVICWCN